MRRLPLVSLSGYLKTGLATLMLCLLTFSVSAPGQALGDKDKDEDHPDKRAEWMLRGRVAPKGQNAAALRLRAHQQKMAMRGRQSMAQSAATPLASTPWVPLGPAPLASDGSEFGLVSGRVTSIAVDPSDTTGNTVYAASASGGVWKSTNAANSVAADVTWTPVTDQQASLTNGAVSVKSDGSVVLVGTGEPDNAIDSYYGVGILRSADKGATWTLATSSDSGAHPFAGLGFTKFAWLPSSNTVVAAAADAFKGDQEALLNPNTSNLGMYLSIDGGQTWKYEQPTDGSLPYTSATDVTYNAAAGKFFASLQYHGVYSSTNGTSWTRITNQPDPTDLTLTNCPTTVNFNNNSCPLYRGQLTTVPGRNEMYFWYVDGNDDDLGIWQSLNGGTSWTKINETGITSCGDSGGCGTQQAFYNLEVSAVADGSATDIYAGAVNLFKCKLASGATTCSTVDANLPNSWLNLTHVYGCPAVATVHPDEHGLDFMVVGGKDIMYFGNDGGVYRALNGFGLDIGSCSSPGTNAFDDLNPGIGSMTQFVSFSNHPTDQNTLLGGTQDNGSPASDTATTSSQFVTVLGGDGGYNAIDPNNADNWYASNPGSEIGICTTGNNLGCNDENFFYLASPDQIGNIDFGAFYTPFILDPQSTGEMLIGTCRVWRGSTATGDFTLLSVNFDTLTSASCTGNEVNQVHGLAAGGPKDSNGLSNVIYAVTFGLGPLYDLGTGGEVWATTNASTTQLSNVSGSINFSEYAISSVAIDKSDSTGLTAYVGIMGFNTSHIWKTTTAGASAWTDWSGSGGTALPDSPVNDVLVDSAVGLIYAATDVGLFVSSTSSPSWSEVGTPSTPGGAAGYLPNVPVSAIRIFNNGSTKELRVSTYGRGIWQFNLAVPSDFTNVISNSPQTVFPTQTATFNGTLTSQGGYNSPVNITCTGTTPTTCTPAPTPLTPTTGGATYTVTAGGTVGDYSFNAHAVGTDAGTTTHDAAITLHVVDFALTAPSPNTLNVVQGSTSNQSTFVVSASGSFAGSVTLSCPSGLPTGAACAFSPSATVSPTSSTPVTVTLTVTASGTTPVGNTTVTLSANTTGAPAAKTQTFALHVTAPVPSFTLGASPSSLTVVPAGLGVTSTITVTGQNGFNGSVTLAASGLPTGVLATLVPNPTTTTSTLTLTASASAVPGTATVTITGTSGALTASVMIPLTVVQSFPLPGTLTNPAAANPGQSTSTTMLLAPFGGGNFINNVTYTASGLPTGATVAFNPTQINSGTGSTSVKITIQTAGPFTGMAGGAERGGNRRKVSENRPLWLPLTMPLAGIVLVGLFGRGISRRYQIAGLCLALLLIGFLVACGSGGSSTPVVTVSPSSVSTLYPNLPGAPAGGQAQQFSATVSNTTSQSVTWAVSGGAANGTIDQTGLYTAPATLPNPNSPIMVTATSTATTTPGSATVNLKAPTVAGPYPITVSVTEGTVTKMTTFTLTVN